jgi:two-component system phosphate regulon sensor histidine kinase PhoR
VAFAPDGQHALTGGGSVSLWYRSGATLVRGLPYDDVSEAVCVAVASDGRRALFGGSDGTVSLWDVASGLRIHGFQGHTGRVTGVAFSPDGPFALSGSADGSVVVGLAAGARREIMSLGRSRTFWRLFGTFGLLVLAAVIVLGALLSSRIERHEMQQVEESLHIKAVLVEAAVRHIPPDQLQAELRALRKKIDARITLIGTDGKVLADTEEDPGRMENHADRPEFIEARRNGTGTATRYSHTLGANLMYLARRVEPATSQLEVVRVARPVDSIHAQLAELRRVVWGVAGLTAAASMLLAFWGARRLAQPLQELTAGAERLAAGEYGLKVYADSTDEVGTLARAFNAMSEKLAGQFAQVEEDRQQLRAILGGMVEGVVAIDAEQRILFANERAAELLGISAAGGVGRKLWEVVRQRAIQEAVDRALAGTEPYHEELDWNGPVCTRLVVHIAQLPGSPARGAVLVLHDTSELRRLERVRQEFVANVSHELKTPLSVIKANVETLIDGAIDDAEHRGSFLELIDEQANRLHALIIDLLSLARIESSAGAFEFQPVPLALLVGECLERHRARAEGRRQVLEVGPAVAGNGQPAPELAAWADEEAVDQILDNLVDNAVKYTPEGGRIHVRWYAEDGCVCLEVADTGIGIPERDLPRIFERFYRVDRARSRELGGTGLGLSIVKHLVQAMQGSVRATSHVGQGTTFTVRLPRAPAG